MNLSLKQILSETTAPSLNFISENSQSPILQQNTLSKVCQLPSSQIILNHQQQSPASFAKGFQIDSVRIHINEIKIMGERIKERLDILIKNYEQDYESVLKLASQSLKKQRINKVNDHVITQKEIEIIHNSSSKLSNFPYSQKQQSIHKIHSIQQQIESFIVSIQVQLRAFHTYSQKIELFDRYQQSAIKLYNLDKHQDSLSLFLSSLKINPYDQNIHTLFKIGICYLKIKNYDQAQSYFKKCLDINPLHQLSLHNLALISLKKKQYEKVIELQSKIIEDNPDQDNYFWIRSKANQALGKYSEVIKDLKQAIFLNPIQKYYNKKDKIQNLMLKIQNTAQKATSKQFNKIN